MTQYRPGPGVSYPALFLTILSAVVTAGVLLGVITRAYIRWSVDDGIQSVHKSLGKGK